MVSLRRGIVTISTPAGIAATAFVSFTGAEAASTGFTSSEGTAAGAAAPPKSADISSPSFPIIASNASTGAPSPSGIPICKSVPL